MRFATFTASWVYADQGITLEAEFTRELRGSSFQNVDLAEEPAITQIDCVIHHN